MGIKFDLITDNPFRVMSIEANADSAQIDDAVDYILDEISLFGGEGQSLDYDLAEFPLPDRSAESISKYQQMLQQDGDYYRMFWFVSKQYTKTWHEFSDINERLKLIMQGPNPGNYDAFLSVVLFAVKNIQNDSVMTHVWPCIFYYLKAMSDDNVLMNVFAPRYVNAQIAVLKRGFSDLKQACIRVLSDLSHFDYVLKGYTTWNENEVIQELKEEIIASYIEQLTQLSNTYLDNNIPIDTQGVKTVETQKFEYGLYHVVPYLDKLNNTLKNKQVKQLLVWVNARLATILSDLADMGRVQEKDELLEKARQTGASAYHIRMVYEAYEKEDWNLLLEHVHIGIHAGSLACVSNHLYYLNNIIEDYDKTIEVGNQYFEEYPKIASFKLGSAYYEKGDYGKAEYYWKIGVDEGDAYAALELTFLYSSKEVLQKLQMTFTESSKYVVKYYGTAMHLAPNKDNFFEDYDIHQLKERRPKGVAWIAAAFRHLELCNGNPDPGVLAKLREKFIQYNPVEKKYRIDREGLSASGRPIMEGVSYAEDAFWASIYDFSIMAQMIPQGINRLMQNPSGDEMKDMLSLAYLYTCKSLVHVQDVKTDLDDYERIYQYLKRVNEMDDGSDSWRTRMLMHWIENVEDRIGLLKELLVFQSQYPDEAGFVLLEYCDYACNPKNSPVKVDVCETADLYKKIKVCTGFDAEEMKLSYSKVKNYRVLEAFKEYVQNKDVGTLMRNVMPILQGKYKGLEVYDKSNEELNRKIITITEKVNKWTNNIEDNMSEHQRDYIGQPDEELRIVLLDEWVIQDVEPYVLDLADSGLMVPEYIALLTKIYNNIFDNAFLCYQEAFVNNNPRYAGSARNLDNLAYDGSRYFKAAILSAKYLVLNDFEKVLQVAKAHLTLGYTSCTFAYILALIKLGKDWNQVFELCNEYVENDPEWMNYYLMLAAEALDRDPIPYGIQSINAGKDCWNVVLPKLSRLYRKNNDWDSAVIYAAKNILHFPDDPNAYNDDVINMIRAYSLSTIEWIAVAYRQVQLTKPKVETYAVNLLASEGVHYHYDTDTFSAGPDAFYKLIQAENFHFAFLTDEYERVKEEYHDKYDKRDFDDCHKGFFVYERSMFAIPANFEDDFHTCYLSWMWLMLYESGDVDEQHLRFIKNWQMMLKQRLAKMWEIVNIKMADPIRAYRETIEFYKNVRCLFGKDAGINLVHIKIEFYEACLNGTKSENLTGYVEYMENYRKVMNDILGIN